MAGLFDDLLQDETPPAQQAGLFDDLLQDMAPPPRRRGGLRSEAAPYVAGQSRAVLEGEFGASDSAPVSVLDTKTPGYGGTPDDLAEMSKAPAVRAAEARALRPPAPDLKAAPEPSLAGRMLDTTLRKPLDNSLGGLALETLGDAARGVGQASAGLASSAWAGVQAAGRVAGVDAIEKFGGAAGGAARDARQALTNRNDPESLTQQVFASTFTSLPMAASLGMAALPAMAVTAAFDEYGQSRDKGVPHGQAAERATVMGLAEALGERLGLPIVQRLLAGGVGKMTSKEFGRTVADLLVKEQVGEQATTAVQDLYDAFGQYGERKGMTLAQYLTDVANTAKVTLGQSLLTAGVGAAFNRRRPQEPVRDARQAMLDRGFLTGAAAQPASNATAPTAGGEDGQAQARQAPQELLNGLPAAPAAPVERSAGSPGEFPGAPQAAGAPTILDRMGVTRVGPSTIDQANDYADYTAEALASERASGALGAAAGTADSGVVQGDLARAREPGAVGVDGDGPAGRPDGGAGVEGVAVRSDTGDAALAVKPNKDGTAIVTGDPDTIGALTGNVRLTPTSQGILVGKTRAKEVQAVVEAVNVPAAFSSQIQAMKFAVQTNLAKTTRPVEAEAGKWVLEPVAQPRTVGELTEERRAFDRLVPAVQGRFRHVGELDLVPDAAVARDYGAPAGAFVSAIRSAFQVPVSFVKGLGANGAYFEGRVYLDPGRLSSQEHLLPRLLGVTGHEVEHFYQESQDPADQQTNQVLEQTIRQYLRPGVLEERGITERKGLKGEVTDQYVFNEVAADLNGSMWLDSKFWGQLHDADKGSTARKVFFRFMQAATKLMGVLRGTSLDATRWATNVDKVREAFVQAWAERNGRRTLGAYEQAQSRQPGGLPAAAGANGRVAGAEGRDQGSPQVPQHGKPREGAISVRGYHYSTAPRTNLDGAFFGTGLGGAERERLGRGADPRLLQRVYFYVDKGRGVSPEAGVGGVRHSVDLLNIYDPASRLVQSQGNANDFELAVIAAGFDGYLARDFRTDEGAVVLLGPGSRQVPVARDDVTRAPVGAPPTTSDEASRREGGDRVSNTPPDVAAIRAKANVQEVAPSFRFEFGRARVAEGEKDAANRALMGAGSVVQFKLDELQVRQNRDGTLTVKGDVAAIREKLPDDIKGKPIPGGLSFTHLQAPRVKAILEGREAAYSRGGHILARKPMTKDGRYAGAPPRFDTPAKIPALRRWLHKLALEGEPGRFWYERSSEAILRYVGGDVAEARKLAALIAIFSPKAKVDSNSTFALRAWAQYKAGQPVNVATGAQNRKAEAAMADTEGFWRKWTGEKTGNFATNLLARIDPTLAQGATVDMWMMRAAFYHHDAPAPAEYAFMEDEINRLADDLGWEPQQVQAAVWVAVKARMEDKGVKQRTEAKSEKKGYMHRDADGKRVVPEATEDKHRDLWFAEAFKHEPTPKNTEDAKFDFEDGLARHIGQVSWEARPGRSTGVLPGVNDASYEEQVDFQQAVQKALLGPNGEDLLAQFLGLLSGQDLLAPGVWQAEIAAGMQRPVAMAPGKGKEGKDKSVDEAQKRTLNAYAAALGLLLRQEGVGWHRPFYKGLKSAENGVELQAGRAFTPDEARALWKSLDATMRAEGHADWESGAGLISSPAGMRVVNFGAVPDNGAFRKLVEKASAVDGVPDVDPVHFASDGDLVGNDWTEAPHGQGFSRTISEAGRPDLLGWLRSVLAPRVQAVFDQYSATHGWGDPGNLDALFDALERGDAAEGPRASLTEADPYARFDGVQVEQQLRIAATGETATLKLDAGAALRALDERRQLLQRLLGCLT